MRLNAQVCCLFGKLKLVHTFQPRVQGNMANTFFGVAFRFLTTYFAILILNSIYQAISPISRHNRGEIVDYGAEHIQQLFKDLQSVSPSFDYFVQTMYQVIVQMMLTMAIRYNSDAAIFAGVFMALSLCFTLIILAEWLLELVMGVTRLFAKLAGWSSDGE